MKNPYGAYIGNVSTAREVVWDFTQRKKLTEQRLAELLNRAYQRGRRDIKDEIAKL